VEYVCFLALIQVFYSLVHTLNLRNVKVVSEYLIYIMPSNIDLNLSGYTLTVQRNLNDKNGDIHALRNTIIAIIVNATHYSFFNYG